MSHRASPAFEFEILDPSDLRWMRFISDQTAAGIFHHPSWISVLSESYGFKPFIAAVLVPGGELRAGVPLMETRGITKRTRWISLPFTDHCAPLFQGEDALEFLVSKLIEKSKERRVPSIELRWEYPFSMVNRGSPSFVLSRLPLDGEPAEAAKRIKPKHFRQIDVAYGRGVELRRGTRAEDLSDFYDLQSRTRRRLGIPVQPRKFFQNIFASIVQKGNGFLLLASREKTCLAGALFLHWNRTLVYKYSASAPEAGRFLAMDPIMWSAISWGCQNGFAVMDLGRTEIGNEGLRHFKRRWGADERPLIYSHFPHQRRERSKERIMPLMSQVIRQSPVWLCKLLGEVFYRYSG